MVKYNMVYSVYSIMTLDCLWLAYKTTHKMAVILVVLRQFDVIMLPYSDTVPLFLHQD